jgi:Leucine-rich repeat (LRR) protein
VLDQVRELTLADNELTSPLGLTAFSNLRSLDLSFNNISIVRGLPPSLTHLNLSHNKIMHIFGFEKLLLLYELDLSDNQLLDMSGLFFNSEIRTLKLVNNNIQSIDYLNNLERCVGLLICCYLLAPLVWI